MVNGRKKALILINAYLQSESQFSQAERMKEELLALGVDTEIKRNDGFFAMIDKDKLRSNIANEYDFCVYFDKDKYTSEMLEKAGLRLFNCHEAIRVCDDKMQTYIALSGKNIPMPKTVSGLLCYHADEPIRKETVDRVEGLFAYPIVVKECFGSQGKGVYLARNRKELLALMEKLKCKPHLFQEAVQTSFGKDVRVILVGGKVVACMLRQSQTDFRSNIELGGEGSAYEPPFQMQLICEQIAKELDLDYCGIDVLFGRGGTPIVCEVNSNAFFAGIERVSGVNVAKAYAEHIYKKVYGE
ncbi:MAG: RimK family alpha-L-glutamate ligase [Clostridiales bacterium]|nr:RimK family alpha-L-glutamate ligase [Clostridiales bacterium]